MMIYFNAMILPVCRLMMLAFAFTIPFCLASENNRILADNMNKIQQSDRDTRQYQVIELANKMKVLLVSDPDAALSLCSLALPVGSLQDPHDQQGLAHYTEHMVLMGSEKYPEPASFSVYLNRHAGTYNASTAPYRTAFYFEVENNALEGALDHLANAIAKPLLDEHHADKERNAVNAELTLARTNDGFRIQQVDAETINQMHPASQFSGGNLQTLSDKPSSDLQQALVKFHQDYYSANLMVGVIYSKLPIDQLRQLAQKTFNQIPNKNVQICPIKRIALTPKTLAKQIFMQPAQPKKVLRIQFPIDNNIADYAEKSDEYIAYMLTNRSQNTLFDLLQKQGLIESLNAYNDPIRYGNSGLFTISVNLTEQGLAQKDNVIAAIFNYLQLIKQKGVLASYYQEMQKVLALTFKYQSIKRDMSYVEWLSDQMLLYPKTHILNADYIATNFNQQAILARLDQFTIDNSRIWIIANDQPHNKEAYFVNAPYQIEDISNQQKINWQQIGQQYKFNLPELNPYIADDFTLFKDNKNTLNPPSFDSKGNYIHFASHYFANEPKAAIVFSLRNNESLSDVKSQVMFNLLEYIVWRQLAQLQYQAGVAGISLSSENDHGLMIRISGFNQYLPTMLTKVLTAYQQTVINDENLTLAQSWYRQKLNAADHVNSYSLAMQPVYALSSVPYFDRDIKRQAITSITAQELDIYRQKLLTDSVPYLLSLGNLANETTDQLYQTIRKGLNQQSVFIQPKQIAIKQPLKAQYTQTSSSTDNALMMGFIADDKDEIKSYMLSYGLYKIISPWFYDELRTNEQLGYAVFSIPVTIGQSSGLGFLIQSNQYDPSYLLQRYQAFIPKIKQKLQALTSDDIDQYKKSIREELIMAPQTLDEEMARYLPDFLLSRFDFKTRMNKITQLESLTKADLLTFYQQTVIEEKGLLLISQVIGQPQQVDKPIQAIQSYQEFKQISQLQSQFLTPSHN